ncbi:MAG: outer membrane beta-barrel protein [Gammaproteobacteria bacterium]
MNRSLFQCSAAVLGPHYRVPTRLLCIAILAGGLALVSLAARAADDGWYVGADAGQSHFTGMNSPGVVVPQGFGDTDSGYRLTAGYNFDGTFSVEGGYVHLSEVTGSTTELGATPGGWTCGIICAQSYILNAELSAHGWVLEAVGRYPFTDQWAIFVRAGGIRAASELSLRFTLIPPYNSCFCQNSSDTSQDTELTYGLGVRWSFASNWAARLSWDRYAGLGHDLPIGSFNVSLTSLGIMYQF